MPEVMVKQWEGEQVWKKSAAKDANKTSIDSAATATGLVPTSTQSAQPAVNTQPATNTKVVAGPSTSTQSAAGIQCGVGVQPVTSVQPPASHNTLPPGITQPTAIHSVLPPGIIQHPMSLLQAPV